MDEKVKGGASNKVGGQPGVRIQKKAQKPE